MTDDAYLVAKVQDALAEDERIGELELDVRIAGRRIFVTGTVFTEDRKGAVSDLVARMCPHYEVSNQITVVEEPSPGPEERLS